MTTALLLGLALALLASLALNAGYLLQHAGSARAPAITARHPLATVGALLRQPRWLLGGAVGMGGWALHVDALSRAPLSLVQAFVAGGLVLAVPLARPLAGHRLSRAEHRGVALMAAALAVLCIGIGHDGATAVVAPGLLAAVSLGAVAAVALSLAALVRGERRAPALGLAGGILYGAADMAIKGLTATGAHGGLGAVLVSPWIAIAVAATLAAFFCFQRGLQAGHALAVIALMTAATNVVSILGGLVVFGDPLGRTPVLAVLHGAAFALAVIAAWTLAPTQAALSGGAPARETAPGEAASTAAPPAPALGAPVCEQPAGAGLATSRAH